MGYGKITKEEAERRQKLLQQGIKVCSHCKRELPVGMFYKDSGTKDKLASFCKDCKREQEINRKDKRQQWIEEHREEIRTKDRLPENKEKRKQYRETNKEKIKARRKYYDTTLKGRYSIYKQNAKQRNIKFDLTLEEFDDVTKRPCFYCGEFNGECDGVKYSGIDRIDSSKGYTHLNIISCCEMCNKMKLDYNMMDWLKHIKKISNYLLSTMEEWK